MADTLEGMAWANIIRIQSENDREFARYVLAARSDFLTLALRKEAAIRKIYLDSADRVAAELKTILPETGGAKLRIRHLQALEKSLRAEAERIRVALEAQMKDGVKRAMESGADPLVKQLGRCLEEAGAKFSWLKLQRGFGDVNARAVETFWARTRKGIFLSDRIWLESEKARKAIAAVVQDGIARGLDAVKVARQVEQYLKVRTPVTEFKNMMKRMGPGRIPKNLTYEALRMARTEIAIAHMEGLYAAGKVTPGYLGVVWYLSAAHPFRDECDDLAEADLYGMGAGVYPAGEEPIIPHPNCLCFVVPKVEPTEKFVGRVRQWVQDPKSQPDIDQWYRDIYGGLTGRAVQAAASAVAQMLFPAEGFKSLQQAYDWAKAKYPHIEWDFNGAEIDTINPTLKEFDRLAQRWPEVANRLRYIGTHLSSSSPRYGFDWQAVRGQIAHADTITGRYIGLNPKYYGDKMALLEVLERAKKQGWYPLGTDKIESFMTHEFGHCIHTYLKTEINAKFLPWLDPRDRFGFVSDTTAAWVKKHLPDLSSVSQYAKTNEHEAWAEAFSAIEHGDVRYNKLRKEFANLFETVADRKRWPTKVQWVTELAKDERLRAQEEMDRLRKLLGLR